MLSRFFVLIFLLLLGVGAQAQYDVLDELEGIWVNVEDSTKMEIWEKGKGGLNGRSLTIEKNGSEQVWETLRIFNKNGELTYRADVKGNKKAVDFGMSFISEKEVVFTNLKHDFPNHIQYKFLDNDTLNVEVYSEVDDKKLNFKFRKKRK